MDTKKRNEIIRKLAAYLLHYCPKGALREDDSCDVALCYPRKEGFGGTLTEQEVARIADGRLLDLSIKEIKAVAASKTLARLVGADRTSYLVRRKGDPRSTKGAIRLARKAGAVEA